MGRKGNPDRWDPMTKGIVDERVATMHEQLGTPIDEVWQNRLYECVVRRLQDGAVHLSIKRRDRAPVRDWRHFQAIKNDVVGPDRWAVEIYPPEDNLVDGANEYHLWALPADERPPFGLQQGEHGPAVQDPAMIEQLNERMAEAGIAGKGRQRPWEPGLSTGLGAHRFITVSRDAVEPWVFEPTDKLSLGGFGDAVDGDYVVEDVAGDGTLTIRRTKAPA